MKLSKSNRLILSALFLFFISACGGSGGGSSSSSSSGTGDLSVSLTDSAGSYKAVYITVVSLEVHTGGNDNNNKNWQTIPMDKNTLNLCELTNGVFEELGSIGLDEGQYTQMRLHLSETPEDELNILSRTHPYANYVILEDDTNHELKIPSGFKTGVKIVRGFTINENATTELILDFDAMKSVVEAGNSGKWLLKPTIKVADLDEYSTINGQVTDPDDNVIPGVYVSAQLFDASAPDDKDKVVIQAGTITDGEGNYSLFVIPNTYNLVAYIDGKEFEFETVTTTEGEDTRDVDFVLGADITMGNIEGEVTITGEDDSEQYATISYRKEVGSSEMIEIKSINVSDTTTYGVELPTGFYSRVASTYGYDTQTKDDLDVIDGRILDDISFLIIE
jgi:hypothetical protein